jgi:hypothetical protein
MIKFENNFICYSYNILLLLNMSALIFFGLFSVFCGIMVYQHSRLDDNTKNILRQKDAEKKRLDKERNPYKYHFHSRV